MLAGGAWWLERMLPSLPREVVELIWEKSFPRPFMRCGACLRVTLQVDIKGALQMTDQQYSIIRGRCRCRRCR